MNRFILGLALLSLFVTTDASGIDIRIETSLGNRVFQTDRSVDATGLATSDYSWAGRLSIQETLADGLRLGLGYSRDPVLRNQIVGDVAYGAGFFELGAGPVFGVFNSTEQPLTLGVHGFAFGEIAGLLFISLEGRSGLTGQPSETGDYAYQNASGRVGIYVPNAVVSANVEDTRFSELTDQGLVRTRVQNYYLAVDMFKKNIAYDLLLELGFEDMQRRYQSSDRTHAVSSLVVSAGLGLEPSRSFGFDLGIDATIFGFGSEYLAGFTSGDNFYFQTRVGARVSTD